jgi:hypothetical protein
METVKKYLIRPGFVFVADGNRRWVGVAELMKLYKVAPYECVVEAEDWAPLPGRPRVGTQDLILLAPRQDGKYELKEGKPLP